MIAINNGCSDTTNQTTIIGAQNNNETLHQRDVKGWKVATTNSGGDKQIHLLVSSV